jgi:hypothetical protein
MRDVSDLTAIPLTDEPGILALSVSVPSGTNGAAVK